MIDHIFNKISYYLKKKYDTKKIILNTVLPNVLLVFAFFYHFAFYSFQQKRDHYKIYSETPIDSLRLNTIIDLVDEKFNQNNIKLDTDISLFFSTKSNNYFASNFFRGKHTAGMSYNSLNRIIICPSNFENNKITRSIDPYNHRKLSDILVHELTHQHLVKKIGLLKSYFIEKWKNEGYCEYIANSSTIDIEFAKKVFLSYDKKQKEIFYNKKDFTCIAYDYFKYRIRVDYLLTYKKIDFDTFIKSKYNIMALEKEIKANLLSGEYIFNQQ